MYTKAGDERDKRDHEQLGTSHRLHRDFLGLGRGRKKKSEIVRDNKSELYLRTPKCKSYIQHVEILILDW